MSYRGMTLTWANGRQLATLTKSGATSSYSYDINVNRFGLEWEGTKYYYVFNGQRDVIGITDLRDRLAVSYTYDAWGKLLSTGGDNPALAAANPIRYRGYYYDIESGLYYLGSRYYDPETGRFINADEYITGVDGSTQGYNLFSYCFNNPINMSDETGTWPSWNDIGNFFKDLGNSIVDGAKAVGKFFSDNFGAQTTTTVIEHEEKDELNFGFFKVSKTESISYEIEKGTSKTVTAYADTTSKKVGIKVKAGNVSGNIGTGLDGLLSEKASIKV